MQLRKWAIIVEDLTQDDIGIYTCKICNIHGCIDHSTKLDVTGKWQNKYSKTHFYVCRTNTECCQQIMFTKSVYIFTNVCIFFCCRARRLQAHFNGVTTKCNCCSCHLKHVRMQIHFRFKTGHSMDL